MLTEHLESVFYLDFSATSISSFWFLCPGSTEICQAICREADLASALKSFIPCFPRSVAGCFFFFPEQRGVRVPEVQFFCIVSLWSLRAFFLYYLQRPSGPRG